MEEAKDALESCSNKFESHDDVDSMKQKAQILKSSFDEGPKALIVEAFKKGHKVKIHGLVSASQHNGKIGTVITEIDEASGRHQVKLSDGAILKIKPANISINESVSSNVK